MNENTALGLLNRVMGWELERAEEEFRWLRLISAVKYDSYRDFVAGVRFLESLVGWLLQFEPEHRETAYRFVRDKLIFIGALERERLVELIYPRVAMPLWLENIAQRHGIAAWQVRAHAKAAADLKVEQRRTLFLGLSDGARLDSFRHVNVGRISNEQVVVGTQLDSEKWTDLKKELAKDLRRLGSSEDATFRTIYLVDDFAGSGTSFIRTEQDEATGNEVWKGKLLRFLRSLQASGAFAEGWTLVVLHLVMTRKAVDHLEEAIHRVRDEYQGPPGEALPWFKDVEVKSCLLYENDVMLETGSDFEQLTELYYDERIETEATKKGLVDHLGRGYAGCALPLVLDHNTPNNSVGLLWAESPEGELENPCKYPHPPRRMRPLFRRRQRHIR
jgi:hypothetical protein